MRKFPLLFLFFSFCCFYADAYLLQPTQDYFNSIEWAENTTLDFSLIPSLYSIKDNGVDSAFLYADSTNEDSIFPEIAGLGILDYSSIPHLLLISMKEFSKSIINKKLDDGLSANGRNFLKPLFEYRFANIKDIDKIDYVFFSVPVFNGIEHASAKFRFNYKRNEINKYRIMEVSFVKDKEAWLIESFDFIGWEVDDSN